MERTDLGMLIERALRDGHYAVFRSSGLDEDTPILTTWMNCTCGVEITRHEFDARMGEAALNRALRKAVEADNAAFRLHRRLVVARN